MKRYLFAASAALLITTLSTTTSAQNLTNSLSLSVNATQSQVCDNTDCSAMETLSASLKQEIEINPTQISQLGPGTSVTIQITGVVIIDGLIGDDPNFTPGDGSVKIENALLRFASRTYPASMQLSWKGEEFKISVKAKGTKEIPLGPIIIGAIKEASTPAGAGALPPGHPLASERIRTTIRNGATVVTISQADFAVKANDIKQTVPLKDGGAKITRKLSIKSTYLVSEVSM